MTDKPSNHPMKSFWLPGLAAAREVPRCGAKNRAGTECQAPAMRGKRRCRLHGGKSTGAKTEAGIEAIRQANTRHGRYTLETQWFRAALRALKASAVDFLKGID